MSLEKFLKVYASLPITERNNIVVLIDDQPISWLMAYREIKNNTELGKKIQEKLISKGII